MSNRQNQHGIVAQLQHIIDNEPNTLRAYVAEEAIEIENIKDYFSDLQHYGCVNGMVSSLIYYSDTHNFFDKYYHQIDDLRTNYEMNTGEPIKILDDLKNTLAWFAFEETAYQLALELFQE